MRAILILTFSVSSLFAIAPVLASCASTVATPYTVCGSNGGTTSQVYTPGSVIILSRSYSFDGGSSQNLLPEESLQVTRNRSLNLFLGSDSDRNYKDNFFLRTFADLQKVADTTTTPGNSSTRLGLAVGKKFKLDNGELSVALDISHHTEKYDTTEARYSSFVPTLVPVPSADSQRTDIGFSLARSFEISSGISAHVGGRFGAISLKTSRDILDFEFLGSPNTRLLKTGGNTDGFSYGLNFGLRSEQRLRSGTYLGLSSSIIAVHERINPYTERLSVASAAPSWSAGASPGEPNGSLEAGTATYSFGADSRTSIKSRIGATVVHPFRLRGNFAAVSLGAAWIHEFADNSRSVSVFAPNIITGTVSGDSLFSIRSASPDRDYLTGRIGVGSSLGNNKGSWNISYEALVGHEYLESHTLSFDVGIRF